MKNLEHGPNQGHLFGPEYPDLSFTPRPLPRAERLALCEAIVAGREQMRRDMVITRLAKAMRDAAGVGRRDDGPVRL